LRDFNLVVPGDCVAANEKKDSLRTLKHIEKILKADINPSDEIDFDKLKKDK
jgi:hypothetical protein